MIPKILHYVWVGGKPKPESVLKCIESWKKFCPGYEIKEWNEQNFDIESVPFVKEAMECKKFAFASDYIRLYALYNEGGIYLDADVELTKSLDEFLKHGAFTGFENEVSIPTAVMGGGFHHPWIKALLDYYNDRHFLNNGKMDTTTNVDIIGAITRIKYGVKLNDTLQMLDDDLVIYPHCYFCPKNYVTGVIESTEDTHAIHHFAGTWLNSKNKRTDKFVKGVRKVFGEKIFIKFKKAYLKTHANKLYRKFKKLYKNGNLHLQKLSKEA